MKKRVLSVILALCILVTMSAVTFAADETKISFTDVTETDAFCDSVAWAAEREITNGTEKDTFAPYEMTTRAQVVTFLWRYAGMPAVEGEAENAFADAAEGAYYYDALLWAAENGIAKGISADSFAPDEPVTRAQAVTFLARMIGVADDAAGFDCDFADVPEDAYYENAVAWAEEKQITLGVSETAFAPDAPCCRYQIVTFLYRYDKNPNKYIHDPRNNPTAMKDIVEDPNAVYGFSPNPDSTRLGSYAAYDWSDTALVEQGRKDRIAYHESIEGMYAMLYELTEEGKDIETIARAISAERNRIRLAAYADDPEGLEAVKKSNLETYGDENGPTADSLYEKYGSWETVLLKAFSVNAGMDACVGLYDDYYDLYVFFGMVTD